MQLAMVALDVVSRIKALPEETIPAGCIADLIAVAEAVIAGEE